LSAQLLVPAPHAGECPEQIYRGRAAGSEGVERTGQIACHRSRCVQGNPISRGATDRRCAAHGQIANGSGYFRGAHAVEVGYLLRQQALIEQLQPTVGPAQGRRRAKLVGFGVGAEAFHARSQVTRKL
jgi:hypothetical protein